MCVGSVCSGRGSQVIRRGFDGVFQEAELVEQLDGRLSSQAPGPQVGHLFLGTSTSMVLRHLTNTHAHTQIHVLSYISIGELQPFPSPQIVPEKDIKPRL